MDGETGACDIRGGTYGAKDHSSRLTGEQEKTVVYTL